MGQKTGSKVGSAQVYIGWVEMKKQDVGQEEGEVGVRAAHQYYYLL